MFATSAQQSTGVNTNVAPSDCVSVVIIKCDRPAAAVAGGNGGSFDAARRVEVRRQGSLLQQLDGVVIEDQATRRRTVGETIGGAFPALRPRDGDYTFTTGEGAQCTCNNNCPPWPLPCCVCSGHMSRYRSMPGSSLLN